MKKSKLSTFYLLKLYIHQNQKMILKMLRLKMKNLNFKYKKFYY